MPYVDSLSFDMTIQAVQNQIEFNYFEVLDKHKMVRWTKHGCLFLCVKWYPCRLFILLSKSMSLKWNKHSRLAIGRGIQFFMFHLSIGKGKRNSKSSTCVFGINIRCLRMRDLSLSYLPFLTSSLSLGACYFV